MECNEGGMMEFRKKLVFKRNMSLYHSSIKRACKNVYPYNEIKRLEPRENICMKEKDNNAMVIPYVKGFSESIRHAGNEVGIKTIFSAKDTIKKRLTKVKSKQNKNK
jgi:hypothetical protein